MRKPGKPTIADVAREAGVSKGLVSLALNSRPGVAAQTRERIQAAADGLGWRPNPSARGLANHRAYSLGFVVRRNPLIFEVDPFFAAFIAGVELVLADRGQVLVLSIVPDEAAEIATYRRLSADNRVDGFLITDLLNDDPRIELIASLGGAAVILGKPDSACAFPAVTRDYDSGIRDLMVHLKTLGHSRIAHVAGDERMQHASRRLERFLQLSSELGIEAIVEQTDFSPESGANATRRLLDGPEPPSAIIYANDPMAIAGMAVAHERGLSLPGDLSIAGMDGADMGRYVFPTLTTLDNDPADWGRTAAEMLVELIETGRTTDVALPAAALIARGSTSAPLASRMSSTSTTRTSTKEK